MIGNFVQIAFGVVYTAGYLLLTLITVGAGHGTMLMFSGFPTLILFLACVVMLFWADKKEYRVAIGVVMAINYAVTFALFVAVEAGDSFRPTVKYFESEPEVFSFSVAWYVVGQAIFWFFYMRSSRAIAGKLP